MPPETAAVRPDETDSGTGEQTLLENLLEDSERIANRQITRFQMNQLLRLKETEASTAAWKLDRLAEGRNPKRVEEACQEFLCETRVALHEETGQYAEQMTAERVGRDQAIAAWVEGQM